MPGALHAALVGAPIASGRIARIDDAVARAMPGVVAVLTHASAPRIASARLPLLLQDPAVCFAGQPVAVVVAETVTQARRAAAAVEVTCEASAAITTMHPALDRAYAPRSAGHVATDSRRGDPERAPRPREIARRYTTPTQLHHPLEPPFVVARWDGDALVVHTTTQAVFAHRQQLADCFGVPVERVRVVSRLLGGGFGGKGRAWFPYLVLCAMAARHVARPVALELTRAEMFTLIGRRQETIQDLRIAATSHGELTAITHDTVAPTSMYGEYADPTATVSRVLYACPHVATSHRLVRVHAPQPNPMRAPGEGPGSFALESALDELAHELGIDPLALRLRNHTEHDPHTGLPWSSNQLRACYRVAAEAFGWAARPRQIGSLREGRHRLGWGMAGACYPVYRMASHAEVSVDPARGVVVRCGTQDLGTGTTTILAQLAAGALGVPLGDVAVEIGDTQLPEGPYSGGAHVTASVTPAVEQAVHRLRHQLIERAVADPASPLSGLAPERVALTGGTLTGAGRAEPLAALVARTGGLACTAHTAPDPEPRASSYAHGAVFVEVAVDPDLGEVRVRRICAAYACGRILNPLLAHSQLVGGLVLGIGMALHEATVTDARSGRVVNANLADYAIAGHADMPRFEIALVDDDDPHLAGGVKGTGMIGTVGIAAAIANAVFHATGRRIRDLPIRLESLLG
ncbi:MAG TPA: xanthine dehydrogenase family protein molybdopterin-binding subunit [Kofleriaceae bacterium]|jgi:xanthine dehydrogenase YagR molybdenum-binding subunit|nr:xanthine dehydrogenase family protein molybdopterin-binding subunit [Kofleriaceae bacterium]